MPIHSILPQEAFFDAPAQTRAVCMACRHGLVEGSPLGDGRFLVRRLISTDPAAYLDPDFAPGSALEQRAVWAADSPGPNPLGGSGLPGSRLGGGSCSDAGSRPGAGEPSGVCSQAGVPGAGGPV